MKRFYFNILSAVYGCLLLLSATSCIHNGDLELSKVPTIGFTYASNGLSLTFTASDASISNVSWKVSDGGTGSGNEFVHAFAKPAVYWVQMTGTLNGEEQTCATKVVVAKPAKVNMKDNTFDDWKNVTDPDFIFTGEVPGSSPVLEGKFDYDANYIYLYIAFSNTINPGVNSEKAIFSFKSDSDENKATGKSTHGIGAEYLMEGCLTCATPWYDFYTGTDSWNHISDANFLEKVMILGHKEVTNDVTKLEWAYSRDMFDINSTSFRFILKVYDGDWNDADGLYDKSGGDVITISLTKEK